MKKTYNKPTIKIVCIMQKQGILVASETIEGAKTSSAFSRDQDNGYWDDEEENSTDRPQTPW